MPSPTPVDPRSGAPGERAEPTREHWRRWTAALVGGPGQLVAVGFLIACPSREQQLIERTDGASVVRFLEQSKHCREVPDSDLRECSYAVDRLKLSVIGVGTSSAAVSVDGSDEDLGYSVGVFMGEGCIRVAPGNQLKARDPGRQIEDGFVSTVTGEVYDSMTLCRVNGLEARPKRN